MLGLFIRRVTVPIRVKIMSMLNILTASEYALDMPVKGTITIDTMLNLNGYEYGEVTCKQLYCILISV